MDKLYGPEHCAFHLLTIDFDWLQVHINKEQELQYHRDKGQVCEMQYCKNRGTRRRKNKKQNSKKQSRVVISDTF